MITIFASLVRKMEMTLVLSNNLTKGFVYKSVGKTRESTRKRMK